MGVHIQVRDVPDAVFLALKARAAGSGLPLSEFLRGLLTEAVDPSTVTPTVVTPTVVAPRVGSPRVPVAD
jgi:plasmid stability protein